MRRLQIMVAAGAVVASVASPGAASELAGNGLSCGMEAVYNAQKLVLEMGHGMFVPENPQDMSSVTCTLLLVDHERTEVIAVANSGPPAMPASWVGPHAYVLDRVVWETSKLFLCTEVTVYPANSQQPPRVDHYDADRDPSNGAQCAEAKPSNDGTTRVYYVPSDVFYAPCVRASNENLPDGEYRVNCPPPPPRQG